MELSSIRPLDNALWERLRALEASQQWPGEMTLKGLIARLFFAKQQPRMRHLHPQMTLHDLHHGEAVASNAAQIAKYSALLNPQNELALSAEEIYFLLAACFLHDIGMGTRDDQTDDTEAGMQGVSVNEIIRQRHHERSERVVRENREALYLDELHSRVLGLLCKAHRRSEILGRSPYVDQMLPLGKRIRLPLLAAILRVADEIDLDYNRAPTQVRDLWDRTGWFDRRSRVHWLKHYYTISATVEAVADPEITIRPRIRVRVPPGSAAQYHYEKISGLVRDHLSAELESLREVRLPGFGFGDPIIDHEEHDGLARRFLKRGDVNVLLIDDEPEYLELVRGTLEGLGCVVTASNAVEAFTAVTLYPDRFDVAVVDFKMPGFEGYPDVEAGIVLIRNFARLTENMAIVANTGQQGEEEWRPRAMEAGAHMFRRKYPGDLDQEGADLRVAAEAALDKLGYQLE